MTLEEAKAIRRKLEAEIEDVINAFIRDNKELTLSSIGVYITTEETYIGEIITNIDVRATITV